MLIGAAGFVAIWTVMMAAMMLPSTLPTVSLFATVAKSRTQFGFPSAPTAAFVIGYLGAWALLGVAVSLTSSFGRPAAHAWSEPVAGAAIVLAGAYQLTRWKSLCLGHCRTPLNFLMYHWHDGTAGALMMGAHHGLYCVGCCWGLMLALLALGMMNPGWMALIALLIFAEKVTPPGERVALLIGLVLMVTGGAIAFGLIPFQQAAGGM
jgi:predicted metal-binding membrane protein